MGAHVDMTYKLSDNERTLLSAYMDGELPPKEMREAEQLLARSEDASAYLKELRAVHALSGGTLAAACAVDGAAGTMLAEKLTGKAIEAAAGRAVVAKTAAAGTWGVAGVVGTVAAVVAGVALFVGSPDPGSPDDTGAKRPEAIVQTMVPPAVQQSLDIDTSNLLVPPMTPSDLLTFAVDGTLPIDTKGGRYITMEPSGEHALSVEMHAKTPKSMAAELPSLDGTALAMLDSIQRVVRTSLLQYSNERIALRADMPSLRLGVIRSLEKAAPHLPTQLREKLDRCRTTLMASQSRGNAMSSQVGAGGVKTSVPYMVVHMDGIGDRPVQVPFPFAEAEALFGDAMAPVLIDPGDLIFLQQNMPIPPMPPSFEEPSEAVVVSNSNPSGVRLQRVPRRRAPFAISSASVQNGLRVSIAPEETDIRLNGLQNLMDGQVVPFGVIHDSVMIRLRQSLERADQSVRRADSILQYVQEQLRKSSQMRYNRMEMDGNDMRMEMEGNTIKMEGGVGSMKQELRVIDSNGMRESTSTSTVKESNP